MKKYLLPLSILFAALHLCAQTPIPASKPRQLSRWSFGLTAGPAIPVGVFAGIHNEEATHKTVSIGTTAEIYGAFRIWHFLSAVLAVNGQVNHGDGIPGGLSDWPIYKIGEYHQGALANDWQIVRVLTGGIFSLPLTKHHGLTLQLRALAGTQKTRTPAFAYVDPRILVAQGYSNVLRASAQTLASAFSYQLDAGIKWNFKRKWALLAYTGYNGCEPGKYPIITPGGPPGPQKIYEKVKLPTGMIAILAGVEFNL